MQNPRVQFTVRSLVVAVLLLGVNLGGAIMTSRHFPRERIDPRLFVIREPPRGFLERRWPVFAGGTITLLVLIGAIRAEKNETRRGTPDFSRIEV